MKTNATQRRLLLSTATLFGALVGYGRSAYAQTVTSLCTVTATGVVECEGFTNTELQSVTHSGDLAVTVGPAPPGYLRVDAGALSGNALSIRGEGAVSFVDTSTSELKAASAYSGLYVYSKRDAANPGGITLQTYGLIKGGTGIKANNFDGATGSIEITINDRGLSPTEFEVDGTSSDGIHAINGSTGKDITITTEAATVVQGRMYGIYANNKGKGKTTITANGNVTAMGSTGIAVRNGRFDTPVGTDLTVTTGVSTTVSGYEGIRALNYGSGSTTVTANGDVTATGRSYGLGIIARNGRLETPVGMDVTVTTGVGTTISGGYGIAALNYGSGSTTVTANGDVTATGSYGLGIKARNGLSFRPAAGTDLTVTTGVSTTVSGYDGIYAHNFGSGSTTVIVNGDVTATGDGSYSFGTGFGISARNGSRTNPRGTDLTVTTGVGTTVTGSTGIYARNYGSGSTTVTVGAASTVTSTGVDANGFAIDLRGRPSNIVLAGTLNGGGGGAVRFDQAAALEDRLELHPTAIVNGKVFAGPGTDTLAFAGSGAGEFDLSKIDTGAMTQQFQSFENFQVESGTWNLTGGTSVPFAVTGGTLEGTGTFGGLTVTGGTLAPGNSIGTMIVNGAFAFGSGAVFEVEVDAAGNNDKVIVNGTVNLTGATLKVLAANGNYNPKTDYTIIDNDGADAVVGTFGSVSANLAFLTPEVDYAGGDGNDVVLSLLRTVDSSSGEVVMFTDIAQTRNEKAVAGALDKFPTDNPLFLAVLNQTAAGARQAFNALSGEVHATVAGTLVDDSRYAREAVMGRMMQASHTNGALGANGPQVASYDSQAMMLGGADAYDGKSLIEAPGAQPLAFWTQGYGAWGTFDGDGNAATADRNLGGFISGMDAHIGGSWRVGLATGASFSDVSVDQRYSGANTKTYHLGGYVGGDVSGFALRGGGLWAWTDVETSRAVVFPNFYERQKADYDADTGQLFGEIAYPTQMGGVELEPFAGLAFVSVESGGFREKGGAQASLRTSGFDQDVGYTTVGLRAAHTMMWGAMAVTPHIEAAWLHAFDDVTPGASLAFATTGIGFAVDGVPLAEDSALLDVGLDFAVSERLTAGVSYTGQFADSVSDNGVKGRLTWLF